MYIYTVQTFVGSLDFKITKLKAELHLYIELHGTIVTCSIRIIPTTIVGF